ncbi:uncharacterized protein METZ01_LOCUS110673 [marine metagenome]|uniref:Uncharacterized protein n=1 Tax=marine metagenome TaxID=408172 RepID=A0A381WZ47_9ZZZZ
MLDIPDLRHGVGFILNLLISLAVLCLHKPMGEVT